MKERHRLQEGQLNLFDPADVVRRCSVCGRRIRGRQSLEAGIGTTCRARQGKKPVKVCAVCGGQRVRGRCNGLACRSKKYRTVWRARPAGRNRD